MKAKSWNGSRYVPNWDEDLKQLKHLRHFRNQLVHELGTLDKEACTQQDIDWLRTFRERICNQYDPLAMLRQHLKERAAESKQPRTVIRQDSRTAAGIPVSTKQTYYPKNDQRNRKARLPLPEKILLTVVFAALAVVMIVIGIYILTLAN